MKKLFKKYPLPLVIGAAAVIVGAIVLICVLSSGKKDPVVPTQGSVILSANAAVQIDYSASETVTKLSGVNGNGSLLIEKVHDYIGASATDVVSQLLTAAKEEGHFAELKTVILRQVKDSQLPQSTDFLQDLQARIQKEMGEGYHVMLITVDELTEDGFISFTTARKLVELHLGITINAFSGDERMSNDYYGISVIVDGSSQFYMINAITGAVMEANADDFYGSIEETYPSDPEESIPPQFVDPGESGPDDYEFILPL